MRFADIKGLEEVKEALVAAVRNNHIAHAQLFAGTEGSAVMPLALAFATYLNCENKLEGDACGQCPSCLKNQKFVHPDLNFAFPVSSTKKVSGKDAVSKNFLTEWRSFLIDKPHGGLVEWAQAYGGEDKQVNISKEESRQIISTLSLKAFEGKYKIMLIWLPEYMHSAAANGILKILEEPPENTIFLLVSQAPERLLTTIRSRVQMVKVRTYTDEELKGILEEQYAVEASRATQLAHLANGNLNEALRLQDEIEDDSHAMFREWMRYCFQRDFTQLVTWSDNFQKMGKVAQKSLLAYGLSIMREVLVCSFEQPEMLRVEGEALAFVQNFSKVMDGKKIESITKAMDSAYYYLERNGSPRIVFLDLSLSIARMIK